MKGTIESIAFGGQGILRHEGLVIFIPFTAPEDEVEFEITRKKKRYAEGNALKIIHSSPSRTSPLCPYFGTCGGCQFQHLEYAAQLEIKRKFIEDALHRIASANVDVGPIIPSEKKWAYREHIRLNVRAGSNGLQAGYIGQEQHAFVPIKECPIFLPPQDSILSDLQSMLCKWDGNSPPSSVRIFKRQDCFLLVFYLPSTPSQGEIKGCEQALQQFQQWEGIILSAPDEAIHFGKTDCLMEVLGLKLRFSPFGFIQNHADQSDHLHRYILEQAPLAAQHALDLYCGIGTTSLLLAKRGIKTTGIESHSDTVNMATLNARNNRIENVEFYCGKAEQLVGNLLKKTAYDLVLLNPPRVGLDQQVIAEVISTRPQSLIYTSCMPATLARDISRFLMGGYEIVSVQGFDMFPQTTHVETVVTLKIC